MNAIGAIAQAITPRTTSTIQSQAKSKAPGDVKSPSQMARPEMPPPSINVKDELVLSQRAGGSGDSASSIDPRGPIETFSG